MSKNEEEISRHRKLLQQEAKFYQAYSADNKWDAYDAFHKFRADMDSSYESMWESMVEHANKKGWYKEFMKGV